MYSIIDVNIAKLFAKNYMAKNQNAYWYAICSVITGYHSIKRYNTMESNQLRIQRSGWNKLNRS